MDKQSQMAKFSITMPTSLQRELDLQAEQESRSRSNMIVVALRKYLAQAQGQKAEPKPVGFVESRVVNGRAFRLKVTTVGGQVT